MARCLSKGSGFTPANQRLFLKKVDVQEDEVHMMKTESSNAQISPGKLATILIVTALCSQALPVGVFLFLGSAFGNSVAVYLSPFFILGGPFLLGLYLKPGWRSVGIGLLGLLGEAGGFVLFWLVLQLITSLSPITPESFSSNFIGGLDFVLPAAVGIVVILLVAGRMESAQEIMGIGLATLIGLGLSAGLVILVMVSPGNDQETAAFLPFFLPFLWTWLSAVFFPEFLSHRTDRRGLLIWTAVMLIFTIVIAAIVLSVFITKTA
jgi:hypothetical protein